MFRKLVPAGLVLLLVLGAAAETIRAAQQRMRPPAQYLELRRPDPEEGRRILDSMREVGLAGPYYFEFDLRLLPRAAAESRIQGRWFGSRNARGPITRIELEPAEGGTESWLIQNGEHPEVWQATADDGGRLLEGDAVWQPLAGTNFTAADLQTPFMYWEDFVYEGLARFRSRPTYVFLLYPPPDQAGKLPGVGGARVYLDSQFKVLVQVQWVDGAGQPLKTISMLDFKEIDGQWIPRSFEARDERTRDKTRFVVTAAALAVDYPAGWFDPAQLRASAAFAPPADRLVRLR